MRARPAVFDERRAEADAFYAPLIDAAASDDARFVSAVQPLRSRRRAGGIAVEPFAQAWRTLNNADVISMPDTWAYPWYATWDLAFHCVPLALIDVEFAKQQLVLLLRE